MQVFFSFFKKIKKKILAMDEKDNTLKIKLGEMEKVSKLLSESQQVKIRIYKIIFFI